MSQEQTSALRFTAENEKAEELIQQMELPQAARILVEVVEKDPANWRAYNNIGIISWLQKAWQDAFSMFMKSVSIKGDYLDALINLFDAGLKLKKARDLLPVFNLALEINPDLEEIAIIRDSIRDQQDSEIYQSERALRIGTWNPLIDEGNKLLEEGKIYDAMEKFLKVNDTDGPSAEAFQGLGIISFYQKRYDDAFSLFVESLKINPMCVDTYLNLIDAARASSKMELARKIFGLYLKEIPWLETIKPEFDKA